MCILLCRRDLLPWNMRSLVLLCTGTSRCFTPQPSRLRELVAAGAFYEAALLWGSVLEIQHVPLPFADVLDVLPPGVPPIRAVPCVDQGASVVGRIGEDTNFRSL